MEQAQRARAFAELHKPGQPLLLPNAWDVASAVAITGAGAKAIATTSAGVAWSLGVPDGAGLGAKRAAAVIARNFRLLEATPDIGRPVLEAPGLRELIIPFGRAHYVALYRHEPDDDAVFVLAFRHQREA